jgi:hypothetical protein
MRQINPADVPDLYLGRIIRTAHAPVEELRDAARRLCESPKQTEWMLHGSGLLRCSLVGEHSIRLHVWSPQHRTPGVAELHTHPRDFFSIVLAGEMTNQRFQKNGAESFMEQAFQWAEEWGEGAPEGEPHPCFLEQTTEERLTRGDRYVQTADEIHRSDPAEGSVTIVERAFRNDTEYVRQACRCGGEPLGAPQG